MKCNKCNNILPDDSIFCQFCGASLSGEKVHKNNPNGKNRVSVKKLLKITAFFLAFLVILIGILYGVHLINIKVIKPSKEYNYAKTLIVEEKYIVAVSILDKLKSFKDSDVLLKEISYDAGKQYLEQKMFSEALKTFQLNKEHADYLKYYNYCNGHICLKQNSLEAYEYFKICVDTYNNFMDAKSIINNDACLSQLDKMQGEYILISAVPFKKGEGDVKVEGGYIAHGVRNSKAQDDLEEFAGRNWSFTVSGSKIGARQIKKVSAKRFSAYLPFEFDGNDKITARTSYEPYKFVFQKIK